MRDIHRTAARPSSLSQTSHSLVRPCSSTRPLLSNALGYPSGAPVLSCVLRATMADEANSYLIIIKSLLPNVVASLYHDLSSPDTNPPAWSLSGRIWISLLMVVLVPLSYLRRLDSLRHASFIALFSCGECRIFLLQKSEKTLTPLLVSSKAYLVLIVIFCYFRPIKGMTPPGEIHLIKFTPSFLSTFPIQVFAFTCSQNVKTTSFTIPPQLLILGMDSYFPFSMSSSLTHRSA